jgi:hypothetical protein
MDVKLDIRSHKNHLVPIAQSSDEWRQGKKHDYLEQVTIANSMETSIKCGGEIYLVNSQQLNLSSITKWKHKQIVLCLQMQGCCVFGELVFSA